MLRYLERVIHPRWLTPFEATNVPPALLIVLIAFAYLEEDGLLLCAALVAVLILFKAVAPQGSRPISAMEARSSTRKRWLPHESPRTTKLYGRTKERLTQDEVERIRL